MTHGNHAHNQSFPTHHPPHTPPANIRQQIHMLLFVWLKPFSSNAINPLIDERENILMSGNQHVRDGIYILQRKK
jgi:hypothetical protein